MKKIIFIYPYLTSYVLSDLEDMANSNRIKLFVIFAKLPDGKGFGSHIPFEHENIQWIQIKEIHPFGEKIGMYQKGVINFIRKINPDSVFTWANPRYMSFWWVLIFCKFFRIPVFSRGHGLFKKEKVEIYYKIMYKLILLLTYRYVCYTPIVKTSLKFLNMDEKLVVDFNTQTNFFPVSPDNKSGNEQGIFYIGRVRENCGVDILVQAISELNFKKGFNLELHIVGDGPLGTFLVEKSNEYPWLQYYGKIFEQEVISNISTNCRIGCVPGFMGLNVVHMMSLSLPVLTHRKLEQHMGPEPEFIVDQINGWCFEKPNDLVSLKVFLEDIWKMPKEKIMAMQASAYLTYAKLSTPSHSERLLRILDS